MESRVAKHKYLRGGKSSILCQSSAPATKHMLDNPGVVVIDAIPRSAAGKMLRRELREMAKAQTQTTKAKL